MKKLALIIGIALGISQPVAAKVTVFAAASMTNALQQIADEYKKVNPQEEVIFSFASSSALARQISTGAPADIFVSADQKWMDFVQEKKAIEESSRTVLVGNNLVMIAPKSSQIDKVDLTDSKWQSLLNGNFLAVGDPEHVPVGIYAKAAFTHLGQWQALENKLARTDNVRSALALVERAEAPLGVVYATDAKVAREVKTVAVFPPQSHPPIEYPAAIVKDHDNKDTQAFFTYLKSNEAKKVFAENGFAVEEAK